MMTILRKPLYLIIVLLSLMILFLQRESFSQPINKEFNEDPASKLVMQYGKLLQEGNIKQILSLYHPDAEIIPDALPSISGTQSIKEFYENTFRSIKLIGELKVIEVKIYENIAVVRCEEPATVEILASGVHEKSYFRELFLLKRASKNKPWKIQKYMFSQNKSQV